MSEVSTDKLLEDLRLVIHDAEELLKATAGQAGEHIAQARARAEASLRAAREKLAAAMDSGIGTRARDAAGRADACVHGNPWLAIGAGAAVGLVIGLLVGNRRSGDSR